MSEKQNDKAGPAISQDGAVEIDEAQLQQVAGGAVSLLNFNTVHSEATRESSERKIFRRE